MSDFPARVLRAAFLDASVYEEIEHDAGALRQALTVVLLSGVAMAVGELGRLSARGAVAAVVAAVIGWCIWAGLTFLIGTRMIPGRQTDADLGQVLRTTGFAAAPGMLWVLNLIRPLHPVLALVVPLWMLAAMVIAVRQALDYTSTLRAVGVCAIGWLVQLIVVALVLSAYTPRAELSASRPDRRSAEPVAAGSIGKVNPSAVAPPVR